MEEFGGKERLEGEMSGMEGETAARYEFMLQNEWTNYHVFFVSSVSVNTLYVLSFSRTV